MSVADKTNDYVRDLARSGKNARRISADLADLYVVTLTPAQVQMVLDNTAESQAGQPGAASLDAVITAHEWLHRTMRGINAACAMQKRTVLNKVATDGGPVDPLAVIVAISATEAASDGRVSQAIANVQRAEKSYVDSGGTRTDIDRVLNLHFHASDSGTAPTPTPGVVDG